MAVVTAPGTGLGAKGGIVSGFDHVIQSLVILFSTRFGERVLREYVGSFVPVLLGENENVTTILKAKMAMWVAIEAFEPRFRITTINSKSVNSAGQYQLVIEGQYRPRGHLGDFTVEGKRKVVMAATADRAVTFTPIS